MSRTMRDEIKNTPCDCLACLYETHEVWASTTALCERVSAPDENQAEGRYPSRERYIQARKEAGRHTYSPYIKEP